MTKYRFVLIVAAALIATSAPVLRAESADLAAARQNYQNYCSTCHGINGAGDGPSAKFVEPPPRDFTDCRLMKMFPDADLVKAIKNGGPAAFVSYRMPPWGAVLNDGQIEELLVYVRSFCANK